MSGSGHALVFHFIPIQLALTMEVDNDELIDPMMEVRSSTRLKSLFFIRIKIHYPSNFNFNFAINSLQFVLIYFPFFQVLVTAFILMLNTSINLDQPRPILDVDCGWYDWESTTTLQLHWHSSIWMSMVPEHEIQRGGN